jgi:dipeptidyl aminopeptidase/acylaminoacyl peptidase
MHPALVKNTILTLLCVCCGVFGWLTPEAGTTPPASADGQFHASELPRYVPAPQELEDSYQNGQRQGRTAGRVYKMRIIPHWFHGNAKFWYLNELRDGAKEFILVDAERGVRQPAFDHQKLSQALSKAAGIEYQAHKLPFSTIDFIDDDKAIRFDAGGKNWKCDLTSYVCTKAEKGSSPTKADDKGGAPLEANTDSIWLESLEQNEETAIDSPAPQQQPRGQRRGQGEAPPSPSPDGKWTVFIKDHNLYLRPSDGGTEVQLSQDGKEGNAYGQPRWSPDSRTLAAFRIQPGDRLEVHLLESSPAGGGRAKLHTRLYPLPGDKFTAYEMYLFDVANKKQIKPEVERIDFGFPRLRWSRDGKHITYEKVDRGHQRFRVIEVDAQSGKARNLIDEQTKTFIWTAHAENNRLRSVNYLEKSDEMIYVSERSGWRHLYLIDAKEGKVKNPITQGDYVVRGVERIDEEKRQIWFRASGKNPDQDPYFNHHYRVNFDGTGLTALTEGNGDHTIEYSPDRKYVIDTYSRVDMAPAHELRRVSDGTLVCALEKAEIAELLTGGWTAPEVFVAKGRDGTTDIWGIICRPRRFDPNRKYPVIEQIYAGPQGSFTPKTFSPMRRFASLTDLGFIVVQIDGMGTANRSKAFHDVCWHNLKDAGFPDRILWHKAVAQKYPYYDISRVGITGGSAGGQNSTGGVLFHPEFYKVAVSGCGCHDNRMDKASWNEQWMGYPVGPQYAASSNIDNAHRLRGKLLLIVGEMDNNVPPESTMRLAGALIKAGKDFDLLVVPGAGHGMGGAYGSRRLQDFFVRHLHGIEPPDRNAGLRATGTPEPGLEPTQQASNDSTHGTVGTPANSKPASLSVIPKVTAPPDSFFTQVRERDREAARKFYKKHLDVKGMHVVASGEVDDEALHRTYHIVTHMLAGRPDILETMAKHGTRLIIIGKDQIYTDMPEYRNTTNATFMNERVRGTGGLDVTSFGEENLLNLPLDRYDDESIGVHEFCHTIDAALRRMDPTWRERLGQTYRKALAKGLWKNSYAASNQAEYWAEICQSYFDCNRVNNWNHAAIGTREQLKLYDPDGYELVKSTFKLTAVTDWRYQPLRHQPSIIPPPTKFKFDAYYAKFTYAREFPVLGSKQVSDEALLKANDIIRKMFAYRHDILKALIANGARLVVLGRHEKLSDLPEFQNAKQQADFDEVRYVEYSPKLKLLVVPEENVLGLPDEPFSGKCMVVSIFAKALHEATGFRPVDADFDRRRDKQQYELCVKRMDVEFDQKLKKLHEAALAKGLWKGTPATGSRGEYWAAGVEAYFDAAGQGVPANAVDRPITTREALKSYDPDLFALVEETMAYKEHVDWRITARSGLSRTK